jgi:bacillithiol biosynthesis cysteine-adding enzyme BshC
VSENSIPYDQIPHSSKLFLDYLFHHEEVSEFYPRPATRKWLTEQARQIVYDPARRERVATALERQNKAFGSGDATARALQSFREGAVVTVTGQQVGLFGGPLYSLLKAASAIAAANELKRSGVAAVPIFWLATEDHDLEEINHAFLPNGRERVVLLTSESRGNQNAPVGQVLFSEEIEKVAAEAARLVGDSKAANAITSAYRRGETFGSAFGKLFAQIFHEHGLILLDPLDPELHRIAQPIYLAAMERAEEIDKALLARGKRLRNLGYHEQVRVTGDSTLLFTMEGGERRVIQRANGGFLVGAQKIERDALLRCVAERPEVFSPNVLLRPVVQDYLLPTVTYFGGPAEVAYFAQGAVVYEKLLGRVTPVLARLSATIVNPRMQRLLKRYRLALPELFHGEENLKQLLGSRVLPGDIDRILDDTAEKLRLGIREMQDSLRTLDPSLVPAAEKAARKMHHQVGRLRARAARAELQRDEYLARDAAELIASLHPEKALQERVLAGVAFLAANGLDFLDLLIEAANSDCGAHQLLYL